MTIVQEALIWDLVCKELIDINNQIKVYIGPKEGFDDLCEREYQLEAIERKLTRKEKS